MQNNKDQSDEFEPLPVLSAAELPSAELCQRNRWLIDGLWSAEAVGLIGGAPKCCKTWLALDLAVSVASGTDALGRFPVSVPGRVLMYAAEDDLVQLRDRLEGICSVRRLPLETLNLRLITAPSLRLDMANDLMRLETTVIRNKPVMLVLDPLVRLHRGDENSAAEMAAMLGDLRALQRKHNLAIVLVHHLRKNGSVHQPGQALRGSGDLHAWGDSNLYLRRKDKRLKLFVEHRSAPSPDPFDIELYHEPGCHLRLVSPDEGPDPRAQSLLADQILKTLSETGQPMSRDALRTTLKVRNSSLGKSLQKLRSEGSIVRDQTGFKIQGKSATVPVPALRDPMGTERQASFSIMSAEKSQ